MELRPFGSTGVEVSAFGLGTWKYRGGPAPLRHGIDRGITLIDTAEYYGTEAIVGEAIRGVRSRVFLATKVWPTHFRAADLVRAAERSLAALGTDYIDLYLLHWPNPRVPIAETMAAMTSLVDAGKVRFLGVSNFGARRLRAALACAGPHGVAANQLEYSLAVREIEAGVLGDCRARGIAVMAYTPLGRGLARMQAHRGTAVLAEVARRRGVSPAQVALRWCLEQPGVFPVPKSDAVAHIDDLCEAMTWRLAADDHAELARAFPLRRVRRALGRVKGAVREWVGLQAPMHRLPMPIDDGVR